MSTLKVEELYNYLKEKYGIENTEKLNTHKTILRTVNISIPRVRTNNTKHAWSIHLEKKSYHNVGDYTSLIIGENFANQNSSWSRYIEIKEYHDKKRYPYPFMKIIENMLFIKEYDFKTLHIFTKIFEEFFKKEELSVLN